MTTKQFNPACNQETGTRVGGGGDGVRSTADVAAEGMRKHAAYKAEQRAYREALAKSKRQSQEAYEERLKAAHKWRG